MTTHTDSNNKTALEALRTVINKSGGGGQAATLSAFETLFGRTSTTSVDSTRYIHPYSKITANVSGKQPKLGWQVTFKGKHDSFGEGDENDYSKAKTIAAKANKVISSEKVTTNPTITTVDYTESNNISRKPFEFNNSSGAGSEVNTTSVTSTETETNPDWTDWDDVESEYRSTMNSALSSYETAEANTANKEQTLSNVQDKRTQIYKDTGKETKGYTGGAAKGKTSGKKGKSGRSSRVGATRGGVPSLASLSGMKTTKGVKSRSKKGKKGKDKSKEDEK